MDDERWRKIEEVFQNVAECDPADREAYLTQACAGDEELRREVKSLLAHEVFDTFIHQPIKGAARSLSTVSEHDLIGGQLGPYLVTELIGQGGMGAVYAAMRDDGLFKQKVAIKVVRHGMNSGFVLNRFQAERRILASLDHPNIARVIDGGSTADGRPYFVMEFIEGQPLNEYCTANYLSIADRIRLFRQVCAAVQYAHQKLIAHRDIKPSNILVNRDGAPKLLDFGIAKLLDPTQSDADTARTATMMRMMTPDYASPEQVRGFQITTATDIYSLGAVLYELLTGERPHRLSSYTPTEIERIVCKTEVVRPSEAASKADIISAKQQRQLSGDLDNIILMAMRKEPERRYQSAEQLSDDLRRHLERLPVIARPDTIRYRAGKFVRRHSAGVIATVTVLFCLLAGLIATTYQARRAERRFQQVRKLANTFLFDFHDKIQDLSGSTEARELVVKTALEYLDSLAQEAGSDSVLLRELAHAYQKVGDVQGDPWTPNLGHTANAMKSYQRSLDLAEQLYAREPVSQEVVRLLANDYFKIGALQSETGDKRSAQAMLRRALATAEPLTKTNGQAEDFKLLTNIYTRFGDTQLDTGDAPNALQSYRQAQQLSERAATTWPSIDTKGRLGNSYGHMGEALVTLGNPVEAIRNYRRGADILEGLVGRDQTVRQRRDLRVFYTWLGNLYGNPNFINVGDMATALVYYQKALSMAESQVALDSRNARAQLDLAVSYAGLGDVLMESDARRSTEYYRLALEVAAELLRESPENFSYLRRRGIYLTKLGAAQLRLGDRATALKHLQQARDILQQLARRDPADAQLYGDRHVNLLALAEASLAFGDHAAAVQLYQQTLALAQQSATASGSDLYARRRLAEAYTGLGNCFASHRTASPASRAVRASDQRQACEWHRKSLEVWDNWEKVSVSSIFNMTRRQQSARAVALCEAASAKLVSATH